MKRERRYFETKFIPIQWVPGALSPGVKLPGLEGDSSSPSYAEVKNA
jgi:hypothetical protein